MEGSDLRWGAGRREGLVAGCDARGTGDVAGNVTGLGA